MRLPKRREVELVHLHEFVRRRQVPKVSCSRRTAGRQASRRCRPDVLDVKARDGRSHWGAPVLGGLVSVLDADRSTGEGFSELVHDLRSPLAAIEAAARAILGMGVDEAPVRRLIDLVAAEARVAQEMVDSALEHATAGETFDVAPLLHSVAARASTRWGGVVRVQDHAPGAGLSGMHGDCLRAIANLVDNAFQHGGTDDVLITASVVGDFLSICVSGSEPWSRPRRGAAPAQAEVSHCIGLRSVNRLAQDLGGYHQVRVKDGCRVDELCLPVRVRVASAS